MTKTPSQLPITKRWFDGVDGGKVKSSIYFTNTISWTDKEISLVAQIKTMPTDPYVGQLKYNYL